MRILSITMPFEGQRELSVALALLTVVDVLQGGWYQLPPLYRSGVRYRREEGKECWHPIHGGCEDWLSAWEVLRQGYGDCEDLCAWRASELIRRGERARAVAKKTREGWHILVRRADGTLEDPSRILGMHGAKGRRDEVASLYSREIARRRAHAEGCNARCET